MQYLGPILDSIFQGELTGYNQAQVQVQAGPRVSGFDLLFILLIVMKSLQETIFIANIRSRLSRNNLLLQLQEQPVPVEVNKAAPVVAHGDATRWPLNSSLEVIHDHRVQGHVARRNKSAALIIVLAFRHVFVAGALAASRSISFLGGRPTPSLH